ncbi:MAG: hypothetical protein JWO95_381 [Verrucomicrobiales bacterium]|nr:hypothetical protein [Verrucomicrobiales bacterium]
MLLRLVCDTAALLCIGDFGRVHSDELPVEAIGVAPRFELGMHYTQPEELSERSFL